MLRYNRLMMFQFQPRQRDANISTAVASLVIREECHNHFFSELSLPNPFETRESE